MSDLQLKTDDRKGLYESAVLFLCVRKQTIRQEKQPYLTESGSKCGSFCLSDLYKQ